MSELIKFADAWERQRRGNKCRDLHRGGFGRPTTTR